METCPPNISLLKIFKRSVSLHRNVNLLPYLYSLLVIKDIPKIQNVQTLMLLDVKGFTYCLFFFSFLLYGKWHFFQLYIRETHNLEEVSF